jgi:hypothetical protein
MARPEGPERLLSVLDRRGIDAAIACGLEVLFASKSAPVRQWNDRLMEFCGQSPSRLVPLVTVHLSDGQAALDEAKRCAEAGRIGGFKLHPWLQGESLSLPATARLCELTAGWDLPIMLHDGTPPNSLPSQVGLLAAEHPATTLILGHSGILHYWREAIEVGLQFPNVYLTLCGGHPWGLQRICESVPAERILWGSDYVSPGAEEFIRYRMGLLELLKLDESTRAAVMGGNACRLWKMPSQGAGK